MSMCDPLDPPLGVPGGLAHPPRAQPFQVAAVELGELGGLRSLRRGRRALHSLLATVAQPLQLRTEHAGLRVMRAQVITELDGGVQAPCKSFTRTWTHPLNGTPA